MNPFTKTNHCSLINDNAYAFCKTAELAYADEKTAIKTGSDWSFQSRFIERGETQALLLDDGAKIVVSARGTEIDAGKSKKEPGIFWRMIQFVLRIVFWLKFRVDITKYDFSDILTDLDFRKREGPFGALYHKGFLDSANSIWERDVFPYLRDAFVQRKKLKVYFCGHSLGAAVAMILALKYKEATGELAGVYLYGCPRVGDKKLVEIVKRLKLPVFLFENNNDIVTFLPFWIFGFRKAGAIRYICTKGKVHKNPKLSFVVKDRLRGRWKDLFKLGTDGVKDHLIKNYLAGLG